MPSEAARAAALAGEGATNSGPLSGIFADWGGAWSSTLTLTRPLALALALTLTLTLALTVSLIRRVELDGREEHGRRAQGGPAAGRSHHALPQQLMPDAGSGTAQGGGTGYSVAGGDLVSLYVA